MRTLSELMKDPHSPLTQEEKANFDQIMEMTEEDWDILSGKKKEINSENNTSHEG